MQIEIYSDVVCPWCFIGKRRLEQALETVGLRCFGAHCVATVPAESDDAEEGMDRRVYLDAKFGGAEGLGITRSTRGQSRSRLSGDRVRTLIGSPGRRIPSDAHRLIWFAGATGLSG